MAAKLVFYLCRDSDRFGGSYNLVWGCRKKDIVMDDGEWVIDRGVVDCELRMFCASEFEKVAPKSMHLKPGDKPRRVPPPWSDQ